MNQYLKGERHNEQKGKGMLGKGKHAEKSQKESGGDSCY